MLKVQWISLFWQWQGLNHDSLAEIMKPFPFLGADRCALLERETSPAPSCLLQMFQCTSRPPSSAGFCRIMWIILQLPSSTPVTSLWPETPAPAMKVSGHWLGKKQLGTCPMLSVYSNFFTNPHFDPHLMLLVLADSLSQWLLFYEGTMEI